MENDWIICPDYVWQDIETSIIRRTNSIASLKSEISKINGVMTRSKSEKLKNLESKLYYDTSMLKWYEETRQQKIDSTKIIIEQLLNFGFVCPPIQFEPFEYSCEEFCQILENLRPIAEKAYDLRMSGFRCTLFYWNKS